MYEKTLVLIRPDVYEKREEIISFIAERTSLSLKFRKDQISLTRDQLEAFYSHVRTQPFFEYLVGFMVSGQCSALIFEGENANEEMRRIKGPTDPSQWTPDTVRGKFGTNATRDAIHCSDNAESFERETRILGLEDLTT